MCTIFNRVKFSLKTCVQFSIGLNLVWKRVSNFTSLDPNEIKKTSVQFYIAIVIGPYDC
jgi:hypothetical protein